MAKKKNPCKFILLKTGEELNYDQARDFLFKNYDFNTKTLKSESYAVQVEGPSEVSIQPKEGISREMAEGAPQAGSVVGGEVEATAKALKGVTKEDVEIRNVVDRFEEKYNELGNTKEFKRWLMGEDGYGGFLAESKNRELFNKIPEKWQEQMWEGYFATVKKRYSKAVDQSIKGAPQAKPEVTAKKGKVEEKVAAPLRDVESTAKALEVLSSKRPITNLNFDINTSIEENLTNKSKGEKNIVFHGSPNISYLKSINDLNPKDNTQNAESKYVYVNPNPKTARNYSSSYNGYKDKSGVALFRLKGKKYVMKKSDILSIKNNKDNEVFLDKKRDEGYDYVEIPQDGGNIAVLNKSALDLLGVENNSQSISEAYHADKASGKETELTKAVEELLTPTEYETKKEDVQPMLEGVRGVRPEEKGREVSPGVRAEEEAKVQEEVKEIAEEDDISMPSESEMKSKRDEINDDYKKALDNVKNTFGDLWNQNLSAIYDPRREAQKMYNFHVALVNLARQAIRRGISDINAFAQDVGRNVDKFLQRAWDDAQLAENGQPMIINSVDDMLNKEYQSVAQTYQKQYEDSFKRKKPLIRTILDNIGKSTFDANYIAKRLLKDAGGIQAIIDKNLSSGASHKAQKQYRKFDEDIFGGLSKSEKDLLSNIIQSRTIISIDTRFDATGKKRIKHPGETNKESHEIYLGQLEKDNPKLFNKLMDRADKYFEAQRTLLKERLDEGRISIDSYNAMINNEYSPRVFLEYLIDDAESEMVTPLKKGVKNIDITRLSDGDINSLYHNAEWLLSTNTLATNRVIFHNRANRSLYEFAEQNPDNGFIEIQSPKGINKETGQPIYSDPKTGYQQIQFFENGVRKSMLATNEFADSWNNNNPLMGPTYANVIRIGTGGVIKRLMVTGINPAFALANFPRDIAHSLFFTNTYSPVFPIALAQITKDLARTAKDAWSVNSANKISSRYYQYLEDGGGMDFLSIQGKPFVKKTQIQKKYEKGIDTLFSTLGYINNRTEVWIRLAIRDREIAKQTASFAKKNGRMPSTNKEIDRINRNATEKARSQMDFSRGGKLAKALDNFIPYLNASLQGLSVSASYVKNNPGKFAFKAAQAIAIAIALAAYNMEKYEEDYEKIDEGEKARNLIYMLPLTKKSKEGKTERGYIRIPKTQSAQIVFSIGDIMAKVMLGKQLSLSEIKLLSQAGEGVMPNINPQNVPLVDALYTYQANYDRFLEKEVWKGAKGIEPAAEYYQGRTPWLWRDLGESLNMSPERLKEAVGKFSSDPDNNIFWVMGSSAYENVIKQLPEEEKTEVNDMAASTLEKVLTPFEKKFFSYTKTTDDKLGIKELERQELTKSKLRNDDIKKYIRQYINNQVTLEKATESFEGWLKTQDINPKDKEELRAKFNAGVKFKDADNIFYKLSSIKLTGVKANVFYNEWEKEDKKGKGDDFMVKAMQLKVIPKKEKGNEFWQEFYRLKERYGEK